MILTWTTIGVTIEILKGIEIHFYMCISFIAVIFPALHRLWITIYNFMHFVSFNPVFCLESSMRKIIRNQKKQKVIITVPFSFFFFGKNLDKAISTSSILRISLSGRSFYLIVFFFSSLQNPTFWN